MPDEVATTGEEANASIQEGIDALAVSRRGLRDLAVLTALPAMWFNQNPSTIATGLLGVLFGVLDLKSAYVRFDDPQGGPALRRWRPDGPKVPIELGTVLAAEHGREQGAVTVSVVVPSGEGAVRVTRMSPALPGEEGVILVSARRADFPTEIELHLLRVAVGQATIAIHLARRLAEERAARVAAEAALRRRNAFLEAYSQELTAAVAAFTELANLSRALATEPDRPAARADGENDPAADAGDGSRPQVKLMPLAIPTPLSRREAEVLGLLAQGLSNREIAGVLWLSERTVERHITGLYRKIEVERRSEATAFALRHGLGVIAEHEV